MLYTLCMVEDSRVLSGSYVGCRQISTFESVVLLGITPDLDNV
jgi:hypothetical protein